VVAVELVILAVFVVLGLAKAHAGYFPAAGGDGPVGVLFGAGLLYVTFEGFGVVTNSAGAMRDPARQLPRAMYLALAIVLTVYVLVSTVVVLVLRLPAIDAAQGHVLAEAGRAIAGRAGFVVAAVGLAAMSPPLRAVMLVPEARVGLLLHAAALCAALLTVDRLARAGRVVGQPGGGLDDRGNAIDLLHVVDAL